ncbi:MAG: hypothetical protein JXR68_13060 [Bacteroidales bacterium]|nr:hypothetical protein [Bacteroidales bacterium]
MQNNYNKQNPRKSISNNYIGSWGPVVKAKGQNFSVKYRNATGERKQIALFFGDLLALMSRNAHLAYRTDEGVEVEAVGGGKILINDASIVDSGENITLFDDPTLLQKFKSEIDCIWNDGIENIAVNGNVIYAESEDSDYVSSEIDFPSVNALQKRIAEIPHILSSVKVTVNDETILNDASFIYKDIVAYQKTGEEVIKFSSFIGDNQYREKQVTINPATLRKVIQLDHQSLLVLSLPGLTGSTAEMTLDFNLLALTDLAKLSIEDAVQKMTNSVASVSVQ